MSDIKLFKYLIAQTLQRFLFGRVAYTNVEGVERLANADLSLLTRSTTKADEPHYQMGLACQLLIDQRAVNLRPVAEMDAKRSRGLDAAYEILIQFLRH